MKLRQRSIAVTIAMAFLLSLPLVFSGASATTTAPQITSFEVDDDAWCDIKAEWTRTLLETHPEGTWAPMRFDPTDDQLARMGLPDREWLSTHEFPEPTAVWPDGRTMAVELPAAATYGGTGCFGIRPGALLLLLDDGVGWCSMAHVYGAPGSYKVSTAGHCGGTGDRATMIAAVGNWGVPVLLDFGKFSKSTGDGGIGNDWALISVESRYQHLVSPTMCVWGGPLGMYEATGAVVDAKWPRNGIFPEATLTPDPTLAQTILHYGHGTGIGAGGTPRVGESIYWGPKHFVFFGAITPGDSGSGSNALEGDTLGSVNEAAGINTHIYVDGSLETGLGVMAGTRATLVRATLEEGQILPYPIPLPGAP